MTATAPRAKYRKDYLVPAFLIESVALEFDLREEYVTVSSRLGVRRNPECKDTEAPLKLDGEGLETRWLKLDGRQLDSSEYSIDEEGLEIPNLPEAFEFEAQVRIRPQDNTTLEGLYKAGSIFCTQCEAEGFRHITWYPDRPDVMASFSVRIEADKNRYPVLLSNGNRAGAGEAPEGRHWVEYEDPHKKPCYLFALVAGDLHCHAGRFSTRSGRDVKLEIWVEERNADKCEHAMLSLIHSMKWDEDSFGLECDLDEYKIVAVDDFNMGAMENKGLNIFNSKFVLAKPETATDGDYEGIEGVIGHEYFHNWTGNRVTCRDWFQLSLKEGLTVFRDQEFSAEMTSKAVKRIAEVRILRNLQFPQDGGPMAHPVRPDAYIEMNNFYTVTVYNKGAEVVRMIHTLVGSEGFRKGMDLYFQRHDGQAVTCDDFRAAMADANGVDLDQFERWYLQAGTPTIAVEFEHDAASGRCTLTLTQSCPPTAGQETKQPFHLPFALGLLDRQGNDLALRLEGESEAAAAGTRVLELRSERESFTFIDIRERPVPSLLRNFSAPVLLRFERPRSELAFLMADDSDAFNRWDAGQEYATQLLMDLAADHLAGRPLVLEAEFVEAFRKTLEDEQLDGSLRALALGLPAATWLAEQMDVVDPDAIQAALRFARAELARVLRAPFTAAYRANQDPGEYSIDASAVAKRRMKNVCLAYLACLEDPETIALCERQYREADNMTDASAALAALASIDVPERAAALGAFHERWKAEPLVLDKWFMIQAMADLPDQLDRIEALLAHPAFTLETPNRVRSLVGAFAAGNFPHFHDASGRGYAFLAERILELDELNPQLASRLVDPLLRWKRFGSARQELMRAELERLLAKPELSKDVYEKVSKSLQPVAGLEPAAIA